MISIFLIYPVWFTIFKNGYSKAGLTAITHEIQQALSILGMPETAGYVSKLSLVQIAVRSTLQSSGMHNRNHLGHQ